MARKVRDTDEIQRLLERSELQDSDSDNGYADSSDEPDSSEFHQTDCVGTLRINRKHIPAVVSEKKLKKGEIIARHDGDITVMKWYDKKNVTMISTFHDASMDVVTKRGKEKEKPKCILEYNKYMGGVDLHDQLMQPFLLERKKSNKWYIKLFKRFLNSSVVNAYIIYQKRTGTNVGQLDFRTELINEILIKYNAGRGQTNRPDPTDLRRLSGRHFIRKIPKTHIEKTLQRRCIVCTKHGRKKTSVYWCEECNIGLCVDGCFEAYHTKEYY
ncbi:piggyBac transposable element-derived protein 4-like [Diachasma alloeum]|uniref:piggyBac transposable element-derived protein 4-like n=1 Tax=Diachasma alloeum TaxID=454923 RepID=UPI0007381E0D|nr:piggyBac transposable element-derived protein 4-like [Diachasma alloeum]